MNHTGGQLHIHHEAIQISVDPSEYKANPYLWPGWYELLRKIVEASQMKVTFSPDEFSGIGRIHREREEIRRIFPAAARLGSRGDAIDNRIREGSSSPVAEKKETFSLSRYVVTDSMRKLKDRLVGFRDSPVPVLDCISHKDLAPWFEGLAGADGKRLVVVDRHPDNDKWRQGD
jgi:hypothetical protein